MSRPTKSQRLKTIHEEALIEFDDIQSSVKDERLQCIQDRRFYSIPGAQWEGELGDQFENKPKFEVNKVHLAIIRIINEYRNNRISVNFTSKNGDEGDHLADTCDGLYRADEQDSMADEAYDNAFEEATAGGMGAWRLRADYEDEEDPDSDYQRIYIEPIYDADTSVFFDLQAKRQDKADAKRCYVLTSMSPKAYKSEYDDDPASWPKDIGNTEFDWATPDVVYIAELFVVEMVKDAVHIYTHLDETEERVMEDDLTEEKLSELAGKGATKDRVKNIRRRRVHKYIMSGSKILEDCGYIAGSNIPIIITYGKRWYIDNIERCMGHVRLSKDPQRLKNMQLSKLGEISALSPISKPIFTPEQIAGHQLRWEEDPIKNYPYLLVNPIVDESGNEVITGPIAYTKSPEIPQAMAALLQLTEEDMQDLLGNQQNGEKIEGNVSTDTVQLIQNRLDMQTYIYMSNFAKAMKRCGEVWFSMARDIYIESGRKLKGVGEQDEMTTIEIMKPMVAKDGKIEHTNDLSKAKLDVAVEVGPSSSTKRSATVRSLISMATMTEDPETKQVLGAMAMMNMEGDGISDVRDFFRRKMLRMGVVKPTEQESKELEEEKANTPPSPEDEYLRASAQAEIARGEKAQSDTIKNQATADKTRAETVQIISETDIKQIQQLLEVIRELGPQVIPKGIEQPNEPVQQLPESALPAETV